MSEPSTFVTEPDGGRTAPPTGDGLPTLPAGLDGGPAPQRVGDYEVLGEVGRGGMGVVFKAREQRLGRFVAVKMLLSGAAPDRAELERFHHEAAAAACLRHPNIVTVHQVGTHEGRPFFSMD